MPGEFSTVHNAMNNANESCLRQRRPIEKRLQTSFETVFTVLSLADPGGHPRRCNLQKTLQ